MSDVIPGTLIADRFELVRALGRGTFGNTVLAHDRATQRSVALKVLNRGTSDFKAIELFEREAAVLGSVRHHGIPEVHDVVRADWFGSVATILVMEYVEGTSLRDMIDTPAQRDPADILHYFLELLGVLEHLHSRVPPVIHRDIKPSNIIVRPDGQPVLVDFGAVRRVHMNADEAGSTIVGTYGYMPYEQYMGQATPASDLYALAATFLHLLTGRPPRDFMNDEGRIAVPEGLPGDARLRPIIERLLRPSPAERFATARDVRHALLASPSASPVASSVASSVASTTGALTTSSGRSSLARGTIDLSPLGPVPRPIAGDIKAMWKRASPSWMELLDSNAKPGDVSGITDWLALGFFSVVTMGILPLVMISMSRARRRRLRHFFKDGTPGVAFVTALTPEKAGFEVQLVKVTYEFDVDGERHQDADLIMPVIANRWRVGDRIQVLYIPSLDYDSVIVSAR